MAPRMIVIAALGFALTGCVSLDKYNALKLEKDQLVEQLAAAETARARAEEQAATWKAQHQALLDKLNSEGNVAAKYEQELSALRAANSDLMRKYEEAMSRPTGQGIALPPDVTNALRALAAQNPEFMEFDAERGIIRLKSDVTFAKGSADLTPQAKAVISRLTQILNMPQVANQELLVAGHTDSLAIVQPTTLAKHPNNWYLSSHRAISVGGEMISHGVNQARVGVLGYADQHPIAPNSAGGQPRNRRVEVLVLPTTYRPGATVATPGRTTPAPTPVKKAPVLDKDTVIIDRGPVLNK